MRCYLLLAFLIAGCSTPISKVGVPNLAQVDPGVWRGGQPTEKGWRYLATLGLTNDVKLNTGVETGAAEAGFRVVRYPITTWQQIFGPCELQVRQAADFLGAHPGTYIHCEYGENRTGTAVILYRAHYDKWTKAQAILEADGLGWGSSLPALKAVVRKF